MRVEGGMVQLHGLKGPRMARARQGRQGLGAQSPAKRQAEQSLGSLQRGIGEETKGLGAPAAGAEGRRERRGGAAAKHTAEDRACCGVGGPLWVERMRRPLSALPPPP